MIDVNHFPGTTDNEIIENALAHLDADRTLLIPPRQCEAEPERDFWLLDRAILLPAHSTVVLRSCKIKLSDRCRDNFFRTANCGMDIEFPEKTEDIHIRGEGLCILEGADHPRATGDSSKLLHAPCPHRPEDICRIADWIPAERRTPETLDFWDIHTHSYGTDAGKESESQYGDWRGIGILFANTENFSIENVRIVQSHGWGISLEACAYGRVTHIDFDACMYKNIDGMDMNMENQDGIDLRNGCHHITVSDITGQTGDDVIALTAIAREVYRPGGTVRSTHVMHNDWTKRERDIHDIIIRNVCAHSYLCWVVRLLPAGARIYNVILDGIIDTSEDCRAAGGTLLLGDLDSYGKNFPDSMKNITVSNILCNSRTAIDLQGYLTDSVISNVINRNPDCPVLTVKRENGMKNVLTANLITSSVN